MNTQQLLEEYQYLDVKQRQAFLADITEIETVKNSQFIAAKEALKELEIGKFTTYHSAKELISDIK